jgi:ABC-type transport system involved in Fe-S cluster assembly fused permease/ATPase subunit
LKLNSVHAPAMSHGHQQLGEVTLRWARLPLTEAHARHDEATSALDVPSERQLYVNLSQRFADRTVLFVLHCVSSLTWTDQIVVLNQDVIEEEGTRDQLIETGRLYPSLFKSAPSSDESA